MSVLKDTYHECIEELSHLGSVKNSVDVWAENQQARLQLWAATLGVVARGHLSLAHRLSFNEEVSDILIQLLKGLHASLELLRTEFIFVEAPSAASEPTGGLDTLPPVSRTTDHDHPVHEDEQSDDNSSKGTSTSSESQLVVSKHTLQQEVEDSISQLLDLSVLLRKHGAQQHEDRAASFVPVDENGESMLSDFVDWSKWACRKSMENHNGFLPGEWMVERIERTILRRWRLMCYRVHHADRIANSDVVQLPVVESERDVRQAPILNNSVVTGKTKQSSAATRLPADYRLSNPTKRLGSSIAASKTRLMYGRHEFPNPPKVEVSSKEFLCPYCRLPQPVKKLKRSRWQTHVLRDLCPYICIFEKCKTPDAMYPTSELWMKHIQTEHTHETWNCDMCNESLKFESPQDFASHLKSQHETTLSTEEVRVVSQFAASRKPTTVDCCIICGWSPPTVDFQALADLQSVIFKHMAVDHMQKLALLSLPWIGNLGGSVTMTASSVSSRTSDEDHDYRNKLSLPQDPDPDPPEDHPYSIDPPELSNVGHAFGQPEHASNYISELDEYEPDQARLDPTMPTSFSGDLQYATSHSQRSRRRNRPDTHSLRAQSGLGDDLDHDFSQADSIVMEAPSTTHSEDPQPPYGTPRAFLCPLAPYGCTSTFNAKNEWKRHALTQHFRLGFWRCDQCKETSNGPNDFNRKDLFIQHVRRMHSTYPVIPTGRMDRVRSRVVKAEAALNETAERCYQRIRSPPESCCCVFCEESFEGDDDTALASRSEHIGKHMESRRKEGLEPIPVADWRKDQGLEEWLLRHNMVVRSSKGVLEVAN